MPDDSTTSQSSDLLVRLRSGDVRALARAISMVEDGAEGTAELLEACRAASAGSESALRIGVTGPPGAGKSTLVDHLVRAFRERGKTVGVLAVDPSSPYTGGALLGDRIRMAGFGGDEGVYLRSMASRGASGGLAAATSDACTVMEAAGREIILIETVGAGQAETEIAALAAITLVVLVPGMGDEVQSLKAGIMEIADIFVINKADHEGAGRMEAEILAMQSLSGSHGRDGVQFWRVPIVRTVATSGEGVAELMGQIERFLREAAPRLQLQAASAPSRLGDQLLSGRLPQPVLDHLGIAVLSIAAARGFYASLGLTVAHEDTVEHEQVKTAMLPLGDTRLELLEPTTADSVVGRFIARRGEGLHHIAIRIGEAGGATEGKTISSIEGLFERLREQGVRLASDCIRTGAGGHRYFFIHPEGTGGVLLEIVSDPYPERQSDVRHSDYRREAGTE
jgi:LAO/AO transport system kinase